MITIICQTSNIRYQILNIKYQILSPITCVCDPRGHVYNCFPTDTKVEHHVYIILFYQFSLHVSLPTLEKHMHWLSFHISLFDISSFSANIGLPTLTVINLMLFITWSNIWILIFGASYTLTMIIFLYCMYISLMKFHFTFLCMIRWGN